MFCSSFYLKHNSTAAGPGGTPRSTAAHRVSTHTLLVNLLGTRGNARVQEIPITTDDTMARCIRPSADLLTVRSRSRGRRKTW